MIDTERFDRAYMRVTAEDKRPLGIGTLGEKSLHRILKLYYEEREEFHEIPYLGIVADIKNEDGITEIQTGSFAPLIKKLEKLLKTDKVTVVYPIIREKKLIWLDPGTGELSEPKKSPKKGRYTDALPELSKLSELLFHENLTFRLLLLDADEYKYLDGRGKDKKKKATKIEKLPKRLISECIISTKEDLRSILPPLPSPFAAADFNKATGLRRRKAFFSLKLLKDREIVKQVGKAGNAFLYSIGDE